MRRCLGLLLTVAFAGSVFAQSKNDARLRSAIEPLVKSHKGDIGLSIASLTSDVRYEHNAETPMPTASLIKLPLMVAAYQLVDDGKVDLSQRIPLQAADKAPGSGVLTDHFSDGVELTLRDYVRLMIRYSDNTATNIVAERIGLRTTAKAMEEMGLQHTKLHSKVYRGDTTVFPKRSRRFGIGSTTAREMVELLKRLETGKIVSEESTKAMQEHLLACDDDTKIAAGLPAGIRFAHKTGAIANCRTDAGIIATAAGPVAVCFLSNKNEDQTWSNDNQANVLAAKIGEIIVDRFGAETTDDRLQEGSYGKLVEALQRTLNKRLSPSPSLSIDGDFGPATRGAVERFQKREKLTVSGIVTESTWKALGKLIEHDNPVPTPDVVNSERLSVEPQTALTAPPVVTSKAWVIADAVSGKIAFEHNADKSLDAASTTKIMTALLVARFAEENPEVLAERVTFSKRADETVGSTSGIRAGESVSVKELLYGVLLPSGNDASVALAEHFGKRFADASTNSTLESYDLFVSAMNQQAKELGLTRAHYTNTHGLSHDKHKISARDLTRLGYEAMQNDLLREIVGKRQFGCTAMGKGGYKRDLMWKNTNRLLGIEGYSGIKTGTTSAAGACLVGVGQRDGDQLIVTILGSSSSDARYADIRNLFHWAWRVRQQNSKDQ